MGLFRGVTSSQYTLPGINKKDHTLKVLPPTRTANAKVILTIQFVNYTFTPQSQGHVIRPFRRKEDTCVEYGWKVSALGGTGLCMPFFATPFESALEKMELTISRYQLFLLFSSLSEK
ncbi:hypothetical protein POVWA2_034440 [Plasmodium ovale wallikeri]|uniref:Uncharacterized protein n=1 Tax=Plasmodium ovale wallikeri TaxID=864142 RepID=A0A1A8YZT3_PLAOA|nr:hypothetical protein POVWA1_035270 [Plasmodium ovale wallikeri]SBT37708.1 hypothetical protein POVWA2_034440 [Plasmodium ovale wallikeri]